MAKEESVVKSFRISEELFEKANEVFKKEGFSFSEVIRLLCDATIREGRVPRGLSTKELESKLDKSQVREKYIDNILGMVGIVPEKQRDLSVEERLLQTIFKDQIGSDGMSNKELRDWGMRWGFPDDLSISTLAELRDCGLFSDNPWFGAYDADIEPAKCTELGVTDVVDEDLRNTMQLLEHQNNIRDNLEQIKRKFEVRAIKYRMEYDNIVSENKGGNEDEENE